MDHLWDALKTPVSAKAFKDEVWMVKLFTKVDIYAGRRSDI